MSTSEAARHRVFEALKGSYGEEVAGDVLEMLPPAGVPDLATKDDLAALEARMEGRFEALEARMDGRFEVAAGRFAALEGRMEGRFELVDQRFDELGRRVDVRFEALEARLGERIELQATRFIRWMSAAAGVSLAVAGSFRLVG